MENKHIANPFQKILANEWNTVSRLRVIKDKSLYDAIDPSQVEGILRDEAYAEIEAEQQRFDEIRNEEASRDIF